MQQEQIEQYNCPDCRDTGIRTRTEWTGEDESYEEEGMCECVLD